MKFHREKIWRSTPLNELAEAIDRLKPKTILAFNHRAAFWLSALKRRGRLTGRLWAGLTDYGVSAGWRFLFWEQIERSFGPVSVDDMPSDARAGFIRMPIQVSRDVHRAAALGPGDKNQVLVTGGGWGLGPLASVVRSLYDSNASLRIHVACGDNAALRENLLRLFPDRVQVWGNLSSLAPLYERCRAVVARPGGVTVTEVRAANRRLFLLPGLPFVEEANRRYAIRDLDAIPFDARAFASWYRREPAGGMP